MSYEPVFLEPRAREFLRTWPNVPDALQGAYTRLYNARLIATPPDERNVRTSWPTGPCLTNLGVVLKAVIDSQSFNFFCLTEVLAPWSAQLLANRRPDIAEYLQLFRVSFEHPDVKAIIRDRMRDQPESPFIDRGWLTPVGEVPVDGRRLVAELATYEAAENLLDLVSRLKVALVQNREVRAA